MPVNILKKIHDIIFLENFERLLLYVFKKIKRLKDLREDKDEKQIAIKFLGILAKFYNTSADYILGLTDNIKPYKSKNKLEVTNWNLKFS